MESVITNGDNSKKFSEKELDNLTLKSCSKLRNFLSSNLAELDDCWVVIDLTASQIRSLKGRDWLIEVVSPDELN